MPPPAVEVLYSKITPMMPEASAGSASTNCSTASVAADSNSIESFTLAAHLRCFAGPFENTVEHQLVRAVRLRPEENFRPV